MKSFRNLMEFAIWLTFGNLFTLTFPTLDDRLGWIRVFGGKEQRFPDSGGAATEYKFTYARVPPGLEKAIRKRVTVYEFDRPGFVDANVDPDLVVIFDASRKELRILKFGGIIGTWEHDYTQFLTGLGLDPYSKAQGSHPK